MLGKGGDDLVDDDLRGRRAGGKAQHPDIADSVPRDLGGALDEQRVPGPRPFGNLDEAARIGRVRRADNQERSAPVAADFTAS
jgi:hypothetical protein